MKIQLKKIIWSNIVLVVLIGLYGFITDEPYWRDNGHSPWLYDYLFWTALVLNGPSGFLADYLSWLLHVHVDWRFLLQYVLWCLLLWPQWLLYDWFANWYRENFSIRIIFHGFTLLLIVSGSIASYNAWLFGHRPSEFFIDKYFWFVRIVGLACSGIVILAYAYIAARQDRSKTIC